MDSANEHNVSIYSVEHFITHFFGNDINITSFLNSLQKKEDAKNEVRNFETDDAKIENEEDCSESERNSNDVSFIKYMNSPFRLMNFSYILNFFHLFQNSTI
jgi:hypothetical protein